MNRQLKFRQLIQGESGPVFHYWGFVESGFVSPVLVDGDEQALANSDQSTGLRDKNGTEVYERDRIRIYANDRSHHFDETIHDICRLYVGDPSKNWEVIGNTHQHPRLLGGQGQ